ncbi:hypothetical protein Glove_80g10 [Diversispora epigaea]|uniref:Uncharacterized protein n=2 Tax=Diversispora epigaea TaxID=1348612 RepID=A0A397J836_9GLOM|nr:hypothetical protein Glove_80g10 [Diversispora epigaea]
MSTELYNKIYEFLTTAEDRKINAISIVYLGMKEDRWIDQNELKAVVNQAVSSASNVYMNGSERQLRIFRILTQRSVYAMDCYAVVVHSTNLLYVKIIARLKFDNAFEGVYALYDMGAIKTDKEQPLSSDQIENNIDELKRKLGKDTSPLYHCLYSDVDKIPVQELTWKDPLASQVIRDNSDLFDNAFEGVYALYDMGAIKTDKEQPLSSDQIENNIDELKRKLGKDTSPLYHCLYSDVDKIPVQELTWKDPLASQVIRDNSDLVQKLPGNLRRAFMKPVKLMKPALTSEVEDICKRFVLNFSGYNNYNRLPEKLIHDGSWKESGEKISYVVEEILGTLEDIWNNPALSYEVAKTLNEGTYQSTVIVLTIRAVLKNLPLGSSSFISTSERQSIASADRRGVGRRPDIMFVIKHLDVFFELMYIECSRLFCTEQKKVDDDIKVWRECNDGMYYTRKTVNPDKDQFGIIGVQIAGDTLHLNVLIRDKTNVHRYYHIQSAKIPVQFSDEGDVIKFVETLLLLRNILITNISLLCHGTITSSQRLKEGSTTVTTPRDDYP